MSPEKQKDFRRALGQFPTGVTVITAVDAQGEPVGVTASSFNSVSIEPPLVLWSVARSAYSATIFENAEHFIVNVLGRHQVDVSNACARQGEDKFAQIDWQPGLGGVPVIANTAACFQCKTWNLYDGGDHIIVVGEVLEYSQNDSIMPLVFARGSYALVAPQPVSPADAANLPKDGFLANYSLYQLHRAYSSYSAELYTLLMSEFDISAEEWRLLTLIADAGDIGISSILPLVMQPEEECRDCLQGLADRGYLDFTDDDHVVINRSGADIAEQLFSYAKSHEENALKRLSKEQQDELSMSLKTVAAAFA